MWIGEKIKDGSGFRVSGCVCAYEFMWASSDSYRFQIGQIFRRNHHILSSVVRIHKACIAPQNQSTYYVFIKRKHIPTLIFKWIFKRNTQSHPLSMCSSLLSPGQSYSICSFLSLFLTLSSPDALTKQTHTRFGSGWRTRCRQRSQKGHKHTHTSSCMDSHSPHPESIKRIQMNGMKRLLDDCFYWYWCYCYRMPKERVRTQREWGKM